jgi:hypothetical protein
MSDGTTPIPAKRASWAPAAASLRPASISRAGSQVSIA